jgi:uncharacterized protein involved in exopolysaccharide biosynthesis
MSRPPSPAQLHDDDDFEDDDFAAPGRREGSSPRTKRLLLDLAGRWHWIVLGLILGLLAASYYLSKAPKQYTATSTLLIKQQTASVMARAQVEEIAYPTIGFTQDADDSIREICAAHSRVIAG